MWMKLSVRLLAGGTIVGKPKSHQYGRRRSHRPQRVSDACRRRGCVRAGLVRATRRRSRAGLRSREVVQAYCRGKHAAGWHCYRSRWRVAQSLRAPVHRALGRSRRDSQGPEGCWVAPAPSEMEDEVADNVTWSTEPKGVAEFNLELLPDHSRRVRVSRPAASHCGPRV